MEDQAAEGHVFVHWARKYWERGLAVIPCVGKAPVTKFWQQYANALPDEATLSEWERSYAACNIGLACGAASNVIALDLDSDALISHPDIPRSTLVRRGRKGEVRFFKYRAGIPSRAFKHLKLDLISAGKQVILPPSIHPETKIPYVWIGSDDFSDLPELPVDVIKTLERLEREAELAHIKSKKDGLAQEELPGRNNRLKEIACAMFARGEPFEAVVYELIKVDSTHKIPLFTDKTEGNEGESYANAVRFAASVLQSLAKKGGVIETAPPEPPSGIKIGPDLDLEEESLFDGSKSPSWKPPIPGSGLIRLAYDYQLDIADDESPSIFLGGALSLVSALCGNRFVYKGTAPNLYVLTVSPTGQGKGWAYKLMQRFLAPTGIYGHESLASASALFSDFGARPFRTRFDPLDEIGELLANMKDGNSSQTGIVDALCRAWDLSTEFYSGKAYSKKENNISACWQPYYSILASTTPAALMKSYRKDWTDKGLLPRFITLFQMASFGFKESGDGSEFAPFIEGAVKKLMGMKIPVINPITGEIISEGGNYIDLGGMAGTTKLMPRELKAEPRAADLLLEIRRKNRTEHMRNQADNLGGSARGFIARHAQLTTKLAILHAVSENLDETDTIYLESVLWAQSIVEGLWGSTQESLEELHSVSDWERQTKNILFLLQKAPARTMSKSDILRKIQQPGDLVDKMLSFLEDSKRIEKILPKAGEFSKAGRRPIRYKFLSSNEQRTARMREDMGADSEAN